MEKKIKNVYHFANNMVMVFDEKGEQISDYQGIYEDVKQKILDNANKKTKFFRATDPSGWGVGGKIISRKQF